MSARRTAVTMPAASSRTSAVEALAIGDETPQPGVVKLLSPGEAQRLTQAIKLTASGVRNGLFKLRNLIDEAKRSNAWSVLGFASWTAYLVDALGDEPMRVSREERLELVGYLSGEGLSTRAIAPIVGSSVGTVHNDREVFRNEHLTKPDTDAQVPDGDEESQAPDVAAVAARVEAPQPPRAVTGLDGKTYTRPSTPSVSTEARERAEAERAAQQEWNAFRDLYSGIVRSVSSLASYATHNPARLFSGLEAGMFTPIEEREFTAERMRAAVTTLQRFIEWKEQGDV